ncbi:Respiratory supercomplex factor 1 [Colletotrichum sidae]|uniref:Respiratory supercomplex factor 1 n=3 Tax=Colletotrichum orbiculare species complex TaxID=2707354 RepID=A0A4R8QV93_COLTR|nr:Respiratory supercomplex factor 1 [Colletotrichum spinosum]TDZ47434.1 Respiratory supercomplex factor 1 [Colletotrichum trifolii]TEA14064.1 Respiratory supercomplex factor 1 [Colletotrichum sidae]
MPGDDRLPVLERQMPSSFDENSEFYDERVLHKAFRKLREEPLIPLGCGLTVYAFVAAWRATRRGDPMQANKMFRARVAAQGFTIVAMVAGSLYYNKDRERSAELRKIKEAKEAEEKRQRWIRELEARDAEEKALKALMQERRARAEARSAGVTVDGEEKKNGGGVLGAIGLSGWGKPAEESTPESSADVGNEKKENPKSSLGVIGELYGRKPSDGEPKN